MVSDLLLQGKSVRAVFIKTRSSSLKATLKKNCKGARSTSVPVDRKENIAFQAHDIILSQPSCSHVHHSTDVHKTRSPKRKSKGLRPKMKLDSLRTKSAANERQSKSINQVSTSMQTANSMTKQKLKLEDASHLQTIKEKNRRINSITESDRLKLHEICFIKGAEGKKVIAKYKSGEKSESFSENLIVSWNGCSSHPHVFSEKESLHTFMPSRNLTDAGPSKQGAFRVHNFARSTSFTKKNKRNLRRLATTPESPVKSDKLKKRKKAKGKL